MAVLLPDRQHRVVRWGRLYGSAPAWALAEAAARIEGCLLVITADARSREQLLAELRFYLSDRLPLSNFPDSETLPYDMFSPHPDIVSERLASLAALAEPRARVVVVALESLLQRLAPASYLAGRTLQVERGQRLDRQRLRERLEQAGYVAVPEVTEHGEFAIRGSLIDLFPMGARQPYRLDLFDEEIDSIRCFDPSTQLSAERLDSIRLLPGREFPTDADAIKAFRQRFRARFEGDPKRSPLYTEVSAGLFPGGIEYYMPLFFDELAALFDYLPEQTTLALVDVSSEHTEALWQDICARYEQRRHDRERPVLAPEELFLNPQQLQLGLERYARIELSAVECLQASAASPCVNFQTAAPPRTLLDARVGEPVAALRAFLDDFDGRVLLAASSTGHRETLREMLAPHALAPAIVRHWQDFLTSGERLAIAVAELADGLSLPGEALAVLSEVQLFGERTRSQRRRSRVARDPEAVIRELTDLSPGAPVVHIEHGVGRFLGLRMLDVAGQSGEFLMLEYAGGDKLYVPVHALEQISRYTGASPDAAPLHRLGSDQWQKARRRAAARARDVAAELLDVYARRAARPGRAINIPLRDYQIFAAEFPFEETPDQQQAIDDVLADLHTGRAMDRVVCGDVGFGKTEVALRAAFLAVQAGRQVAMLVPTTLLAQQHYETFSDRFADWPIRVDVLSRFRSAQKADAILTDLASGRIDVLIGTHRLLQPGVRFRDLGLVIIDEEHRFGVRHKERLRALRAEVDVLTLTATPIPRTLNMALGGLREMSLIATPPLERLAIKTFISEWNSTVVREACLRELKRGGQIYFVHNTVKTIERAAARIAELVPEAKIGVAHGQMRERELERTMLDFYHRRFNLLVCSTIIESGIDIPTANTIIIDRADRLGLAQLHQLRGRVGRSHHRAYAYLITPPRAAMTPDAIKRLEAIESLEELGSGFTLATHDLEIRGAGELLGEEQSGQIQEVGFALYTEMLERAVRALKSGEVPDADAPLGHGLEVDLHVAALLPEDYLPDPHMRLILYKRIASADDDEALRELQVEMIDRFGLLPPPAKMLFRIAGLKQHAGRLGIRKIYASSAGGHLLFGERPAVEPATLIRLLQSEPQTYRMDGENKLVFRIAMTDGDSRFSAVEQLLRRLADAPRQQRAAADRVAVQPAGQHLID